MRFNTGVPKGWREPEMPVERPGGPFEPDPVSTGVGIGESITP